MSNKTWFITGTSQGIGLELVKKVIASGDNVVATARSIDALNTAIQAPVGQFLPLQVDLLDENSIAAGVEQAIAKFGQIDYLVNNAGYGLLGGVEESSKQEVQANFDVNVFGLLSVIRAVLPHMRKAGSGHILNVSSVLGIISVAGWGVYAATKFAVEALSEALSQEVAPFGIKVTLIEPGYFRTGFLNNGSTVLPVNPISEYTALDEIKHKHINEIPGTQLGNPEKAAEVIIATTQLTEPPLRLLLGSDALQYANYKISLMQTDFEAFKEVSASTDFI
ncbi:oxidoreductase [Mucilaginibacter flavus]|uniref:oxidoreductase n=1 Tax=Mucilaginibacter flavus TaxID=931504 RepID=UPI0025B515FA|nr:oxidoreductase [Mucilaginibacter flavus]MDN3580230.1 oxidoreductase [Mucilaginibacter flavus]